MPPAGFGTEIPGKRAVAERAATGIGALTYTLRFKWTNAAHPC